MPIKPSIAVIDDDEPVREGTTGLLRSLGYIAKAFPSAEEFLSSNRLRITTCLIVDVRMGGLELYARLAILGTPIPTILVTAYPNDQMRERALNAGVPGYLIKPFSEQELLDCINLAHGHEVLYAPLKR
jgi:FixJ family two-component response regulator